MTLIQPSSPKRFARGGLAALATKVKSAGRGDDDRLVHMSSKELGALSKLWGKPGKNPATGLPDYSWLSDAFDSAKDIVYKVDPIAKATDSALSSGYDKLKNFSDLEKSKLSDVWAQLKSHPQRLLYGAIDPLMTKLTNKLTGTNYDPIINQLGGPTQQNYDNARARGVKGVAGSETMHDVIGTIAGLFGANGLSNIAGKGLGALASKTGTTASPGLDSAISVANDTAGTGEVIGAGGDLVPSVAGSGVQAATAAAPTASGTGSGFLSKAGSYLENPKNWGAILAGVNAVGKMINGNQGTQAPALPSEFTSHLDPSSPWGRTMNTAPVDYYTYGSRPEHLWYTDTGTGSTTDPNAKKVADSLMPEQGYAIGGGIMTPHIPGPMLHGASRVPMRMASPHRMIGTGMAPKYAGPLSRAKGFSEGSRAVTGPGTGRSDEIPARLSDGEYVMDAETVSMLGDGSSGAGAKKLDDFRTALRKHKGKALVRGKFSPNAKAPLSYLKGGK